MIRECSEHGAHFLEERLRVADALLVCLLALLGNQNFGLPNCCLTGNFNLGHGSCQLDLDLLDAGFGLLDTLVERSNLIVFGLDFLLELFGVICRMMPGNTDGVG